MSHEMLPAQGLVDSSVMPLGDMLPMGNEQGQQERARACKTVLARGQQFRNPVGPTDMRRGSLFFLLM